MIKNILTDTHEGNARKVAFIVMILVVSQISSGKKWELLVSLLWFMVPPTAE
jgi:hypothetical protein